MPKVLLLSRYARLGSSSRLRIYQYLPYLQQAGIHTTLAPLFGDGYVRGLYRGNVAKLSVLKAYIARLGVILRVGRFVL